MPEQTYYKWFQNWDQARPFERLGQAFINDFIRIPWPELYYCEDNEKAGRIIYMYLSDHCYWPEMPPKVPQMSSQVEKVVDFPEEVDDYVDLIQADNWASCVACGAFIPSDGFGYWGTETHYSRQYNCFLKKPEGATHVHWYNK